jgi:hypothetical protein
MKKITVAFFFLLIGAALNAQDFKKVQTNFLLKKIDDARTELDKVMADPKAQNSAEGNLWKARIYAAYFADEAMRAKVPNAGSMALEAFKKYMQLQPDAKLLVEGGLSVIDQIYVTNFNMGRAAFDRQQWDSAFTYFVPATEMGEFITQKNWRSNKQAIDTFTTLFAAYAAQNSKKLDVAARYYQQLADLKVSGKEYEGVYEFLTKHYLNTKNQQLFNKYIGFAKELYPQQNLWGQLELAYAEENLTLDQKLKLYAEAETGGKLTANDYISYGNMFANVKKGDDGLDSARAAEIRKKAVDAFQKAYNMDKTNGIAAFNAGVVINNEWNELRERYAGYAGTAPALKVKREEIDKLSMEVSAQAAEWLEKAYTVLDAKAEKSRVETTSLKNSARMLANLYIYRRDRSKGKLRTMTRRIKSLSFTILNINE